MFRRLGSLHLTPHHLSTQAKEDEKKWVYFSIHLILHSSRRYSLSVSLVPCAGGSVWWGQKEKMIAIQCNRYFERDKQGALGTPEGKTNKCLGRRMGKDEQDCI